MSNERDVQEDAGRTDTLVLLAIIIILFITILLLYYYFYPFYCTNWYAIECNGTRELSRSYLERAMKERASVYRANIHREAMNSRFILIYRYPEVRTRKSMSSEGERTSREKCSDRGLLLTPVTPGDDYEVTTNDSETGSRCASARPREQLIFIISIEYFIFRKHREFDARAKKQIYFTVIY